MTVDAGGRMTASVVIPAHNEAPVIGRCLRALTEGSDPGELEIVVVCNGCDDETAEVARRTAAEVTVIELRQPSKAAALNAGDAAATRFPRFYVDADVELTIGSLRATAAELQHDDALCAAPAPEFRLGARPWAVRRFYEVWQQLPYLNGGVVGNGVYALSARGRARFCSFPDLTADDQFVLQQFDERERRTVRHGSFVVHPPRHVSSLVRIRARAHRGARELHSSGLATHPAVGGAGRALLRLLRRPSAVPGVLVYLAVTGAARLSAHLRSTPRWERDDSSRTRTGPADMSTIGPIALTQQEPAHAGSPRRPHAPGRWVRREARRALIGPRTKEAP